MLKDFDSPLGRGFKVIATQVGTGEEITSFIRVLSRRRHRARGAMWARTRALNTSLHRPGFLL